MHAGATNLAGLFADGDFLARFRSLYSRLLAGRSGTDDDNIEDFILGFNNTIDSSDALI